jgi:hypothetical protein
MIPRRKEISFSDSPHRSKGFTQNQLVVSYGIGIENSGSLLITVFAVECEGDLVGGPGRGLNKQKASLPAPHLFFCLTEKGCSRPLIPGSGMDNDPMDVRDSVCQKGFSIADGSQDLPFCPIGDAESIVFLASLGKGQVDPL